MAKTIKRFGYKIIKMKGADEYPFNPIITLNLERWTTDDGDAAPRISNLLMYEKEIDDCISDLKANLDAVGKRAKNALTKARAATLEIVAKRNSN